MHINQPIKAEFWGPIPCTWVGGTLQQYALPSVCYATNKFPVRSPISKKHREYNVTGNNYLQN
jgi:hypothetical protein